MLRKSVRLSSGKPSATIRISANRYKADGTIDGMSMGKKINNKWKLAKDALCIKDNIDELCYAVWAKGKEVQLIHESSDMVLSGSLK
jgi:hypothetical protein